MEIQQLKSTILKSVSDDQEKESTSKYDPEILIKKSSKRKSFQDLAPHSRVTGNTRPELKGLKASPPGAKFSVAQGRSTEEKLLIPLYGH